MFYKGSLQEGIASAVAEGKAVVCFVRDDEPTSTAWEDEYLTVDDELSQLLQTRAVLLRFTKDSQEAGFLTSFCPIVKFPTLVVIKNGMLSDYLVPDISKEDFRDRLIAKLDESKAASQPVDTGAGNEAASQTTSAPAPAPSPVVSPSAPSAAEPPVSTAPVASPPAPSATAHTSAVPEQAQPARDASIREGKRRVEDAKASEPVRPAPAKKLQQQKPEPPKQSSRPAKQETKPKETKAKPAISITRAPKPVEQVPEKRQPSTPTPPKQYRLQVRLFDGSSVRSSFTPTQTIRADIRPWLESQMVEEKHPFNLKHILTPLPSRTITIAEEERTLEDLGLGSTANLVMVPIQSYTEAYSASGSSLPARAVSSAYGLVSSAVGTATGLVGSFFGYGPTAPAPEAAPSTPAPASSDAGRRPRPTASRGPIIRTLRDQQNEQDDKEFYNGNQLNFQPRNDSDRR
ncbi:hypothetical protein BO71DRAFT_394907 [Aspergillus ellipticus CBS 707.79]|uniref:UBX domain-containing protein 2 n=1 Tax=Aspergillus ellipticus CBS 707.79 TaxID=1448320 RepID=A0A319E527_9EURO|nr:hypothetical protein BO71DRAFT_394907 [Aspergillus ellipticus CBS 707.79]